MDFGFFFSIQIKFYFLNPTKSLKLRSYDSDFNHSPCLKNGHKAHWAVIIGCLVDDGDRVN